jgi:hypothetical protein
MALQPFAGSWPVLIFLIPYTIARTPWIVDQSVTRSLSTHRGTQMQCEHTQTSTPRVGFETTTPVFERAKTIHVLHREATLSDF